MADHVRRRIVIEGIVQGVGFRPAMYRLAVAAGLAGMVGNDGHGVFIEVEGPADAVASFVDAIRGAAPPLAVVDNVSVSDVPGRGGQGFAVVESDRSAASSTLLPPDLAPCAACLAELADPDDRRHRYPFLNCTDCGPRYSIVERLPYDRATTTMARFPMCDDCAAEYHDPGDRRFHAQPTCCPACGPRLSLRDGHGPIPSDDPVRTVVERLRSGAIVAVKGLGGFHLAVDARDDDAVARLRARKHREEKPFALLVADIDAAREIAEVGAVEADLLVDPSRPIVLLRRLPSAGIAPSVAPGNRDVGVMLPSTPLHVLLAEGFGRPLVLTSGNRSHEPMVIDDDEALDRLGGIADLFCLHDRPIHVRVDDSVTRVVEDRQVVIRRARGHAPRPVRVSGGFPRHTLGCGALLKSTICLGRDEHAFLSQHLGDLDDHESFVEFTRAISHLGALFDVRPQVVAHDLHPDMPSTVHALSMEGPMDGMEAVGVQHHHAHIAACLADNAFDSSKSGPVIGIAFDGLGLGADGTIWGGEILHGGTEDCARLGHLAAVPMPGGDAATREPWRMAAVYVAGVLDVDEVEALDVFARNESAWRPVCSIASAGVNAPLTSSAGRLFDAVAALVGIRDTISYEGQAAIELEQVADPDERGAYRAEIVGGDAFVVDTDPIIRAVADDLLAGVPVPVMAARFHNGVVDLIVSSAERARETTGCSTVALSGGVFQNVLLVSRAARGLADAGFDVLTHRRLPANDGGISLGQAVVVAARDRAAGVRASH